MFVGFIFAATYCVAVDAHRMLGTITTGMAIDAYSLICDNVGCIAEMAAMSHRIRERTDVVDAAGSTTADVWDVENLQRLQTLKDNVSVVTLILC
ncbi:pyrophosphate-energized vacuolar membrane proton pump-like protein [Tanacetum coccineum]